MRWRRSASVFLLLISPALCHFDISSDVVSILWVLNYNLCLTELSPFEEERASRYCSLLFNFASPRRVSSCRFVDMTGKDLPDTIGQPLSKQQILLPGIINRSINTSCRAIAASCVHHSREHDMIADILLTPADTCHRFDLILSQYQVYSYIHAGGGPPP